MSTTHELKCWPHFFDAVADGRKTFEVRFDDRGFEVGDTLRLREYDVPHGYTGREVSRAVTFVLYGGAWGVQSGHVVLALAEVQR